MKRTYACSSCMTEVALADNFCHACGKAFLCDAGGQAAGKYEYASMSIDEARAYVKKEFDFDADKELPNFKYGYLHAQKLAKEYGKTQRKDMPVIDTKDVRALQEQLKAGKIDIEKPYSNKTDPKNPFPQGLTGAAAKEFMGRGLKDGQKKDDMIKVEIVSVPVEKLIPIQRQIYVDKSLGETAKAGVQKSTKFIFGDQIFIISSDYRIIDGHHRWASALLLEPKRKVKALMIDLPIAKMLPMALAWGDAIGNKRNA